MAFGGSGGVTLPVYRPQDVTAQAPHSLVSGDDVARSGEDIAAGLSQLGQGTEQLGGAVATAAGQQAAASTIVTRNPDGTPVVSPHPALIFGQDGDDYARAAQDGAAAKLQGTVAQDYADMATKFQGDPQGFQQHAQLYNQQLVEAQRSPLIAGAISRYTSGLMAQHYGGLVQQKAASDLAEAHNSINTQIVTAKSQMLSLARQGGTGTPTFLAAQQQYEAGLKALGSNPLFRVPADTIEADRQNTYDLANSEAVVGHTDKIFQTQGAVAAQKQLEDGIVNNPKLDLTDSQRSLLYHQGMARIAYLSSQNRAQVGALRESAKGTIDLLAKGVNVPGAFLDTLQTQAQSLGDTDTVQRLQAARAVYNGVSVPLTGMTPAQRASTIMGPVSPAQMSSALLGQESGNNPNAPTSVDGAHGIGQIEPATFAQYAKPGESIDNPADNLAVHQRIVADYMQRFNGDPARVAVAYFSGPGNVAPPGSPTPWINNTHDGNGKSVSSYVADVTSRLGAAAPVGGTSEDSGLTGAQIFQRNAPWVAPGNQSYETPLSGPQEAAFRTWVKTNHVAFDPNQKNPDYDMRGFWLALQNGDPRATSAVDPNDGKMHYPDYWKTPYDFTFSNQSKFANQNAPHWNGDRLVTADGQLVWDDKTQQKGPAAGGAPVGPPSANGIPFTPQQLAQNPYLGSTYIQKLASDEKMQVSTGKTLGTSIAQGIKAGYMPSPQNLANFFQLAKANPKQLGAQAAELRATLAGSSFGALAVANGPAGGAMLSQADQMANGGSIQQQQIAMAAHAAAKRDAEELKVHPQEYAVRNGWIAQHPDPLNFADPNALATAIHQRGVAATIIGSHTGTVVPAFSPSEEPQVKALLANGPIDQRLGFLAAVSGLPQDVRQATLQKLAGTGAGAFAVAGSIYQDNKDAAAGILRGEAALQADKNLAPKSTEWESQLTSQLPTTDFPSPALRSAYDGAIKAYYAQLSVGANDTSRALHTNRMKDAVDAVTGGLLTSHGSKVFGPWFGATQNDLKGALDSLTDADLANARTPSGLPFPASALTAKPWLAANQWHLMSIGAGKYRIVSGSGPSPAKIMDTATNLPFVLDLGAKRGSLPEQAPTAAPIPAAAPIPQGPLYPVLTLPWGSH